MASSTCRTWIIDSPASVYLRKVRAAGGIKKYERAHLNALAATFLPKLPSLPPEMVRRVVEYAFHVGDYWTTSVPVRTR